MKRLFSLITVIFICTSLFGCGIRQEVTQIATTTLPVYEFTNVLCQGTGIRVTRLITESVSCLHDYTLQVGQMRAIEEADTVVISGAGLEDFLSESLYAAQNVIDASKGVELLCYNEDHAHDHGHSHDHDPHIWLSPTNAKLMANNIFQGLLSVYPQHAEVFEANLTVLDAEFDTLVTYSQEQLSDLSCRELITFHDGFAYMADAFDLTIAHAIEEESGSEASAQELIKLIQLVKEHELSAIFTEQNGSTSAAAVISAETGASVFQLDMAMAGDSYFEAMYHNIDTLKGALE